LAAGAAATEHIEKAKISQQNKFFGVIMRVSIAAVSVAADYPILPADRLQRADASALEQTFDT
jgi:hypothetical protein